MYTEDEAKFQFCCDGKGGECVRSKCMAWRWIEYKGLGDNQPYKCITFGYCGLAGKP